MASLSAVDRVAQFISVQNFAHPVRFGGEILTIVGIWISYFGVVRGLRTVQGQVADTVLIRIADSAATCCLFGYLLAAFALG